MNDHNLNDKDKRDGLSSGEVFVAVNLLSKIGAVFVIASVIAFSAASEGHIPDAVRMALALAVGLIMLGMGELFRRKGTKVFANAMIYGGAAELVICAPIGRFGLGVFNDAGMLVYSAIAAAVGFGLAVRYKSQGLVIVSVTAALIPTFAALASRSFPLSEFAFAALPVFLALTHCANAAISRKMRFDGAFITGIWTAAVEVAAVESYTWRALRSSGYKLTETFDDSVPTFAVIFLLCCTACYAGGALLNAAEDDGEIRGTDCASLCMSLGVAVFFTFTLLGGSGRVMGVVLTVTALLCSLVIAAFSLKFRINCRTNSALVNFVIICVEIALFSLIRAGNREYIALHIFASGVLIAGFFMERGLLKGWGFALLIIAELRFFIVLSVSGLMPESYKLSADIINLILWFGIMAVLGMRKTRDSDGFRAYTLAALLNAGLIFSDLISSDLMRALKDGGAFPDNVQGRAFSGLLCAAVWMAIGFAAGKLPYLGNWKAPVSITHYAIGFCCLAWANLANSISNFKESELVGMLVFATIIVNVVSVLAVLDITLQIRERASKFSRAVGLVVSGYAMLTLTTVLGTNNTVRFTSCIISIIYLVMAAAWIIIGFWKKNALLRRFGLALALFSSAKLFLFDFRGADSFERTLLFIGFGITLLGISFGYAVAEKRFFQQKK